MKLRHLTTSAMALILMTACTDSTGLEVDDLTGTWTATSMLFTSVANSELAAEIVAEGASMTLVLGADDTYTLTFSFPGEETDIETGTYAVVGSTMTISQTGEGSPESFAIARDGDTLTLTLDDEFDFTEGVEEAATLVITLTR